MPDTTRQLNCRFCGKRFVTNHGIKKYCSDECRITYWRNDAGSQARKRANAAEYSSDPDDEERRSPDTRSAIGPIWHTGNASCNRPRSCNQVRDTARRGTKRADTGMPLIPSSEKRSADST